MNLAPITGESSPLQRVAVVGCCGAGKSTFSMALSETNRLPLYHLDRVYLDSGWVMKPVQQAKEEASLIHREASWVIDGNYTSSMEERLAHADAVVFLDYSTPLCFFRVLKRTFKGHGKNRPDVSEGCLERFNIPFLLYVLRFRRNNRPRILHLLETARPGLVIHRPKNPNQAAEVLRALTAR